MGFCLISDDQVLDYSIQFQVQRLLLGLERQEEERGNDRGKCLVNTFLISIKTSFVALILENEYLIISKKGL